MPGRVVFDIETNGLLNDVSVVHCISCEDIDNNTVTNFGPLEIEDALDYLRSADQLIGHNICGYDFRVLKELYDWSPSPGQIINDTFIVSCLRYPEDQHSLEYWAKKLHLKQQKVEHEDWSVYSEDMMWRCQADVSINRSVFDYMCSHFPSDFNKAESLEQEIAFIHSQQVIDGVKLDIPRGIKLYKELKAKLTSLETKILKDVDSTITIVGVTKANQEEARDKGTTGQKSHTRIGGYTAVNKNYFKTEELKSLEKQLDTFKYPDISSKVKDFRKLEILRKKTLAQGPFTKIKVDTINLNSPKQVSDLLLSLGWKPTEYNSKKMPDGKWKVTGPKLTEDSYNSLPAGLGKLIAQYNIVKHRKGMLLTRRKREGKWTGLLALASTRDGGRLDGRVSADGFTCGTNTGRYRHFGVVNIPRPSTPYGKELRELFTVDDGSYLVGVDLSGIEAVVLAHYCYKYKGGQALVDEILKGDFHQANADLWGVDRDTAKSILYALGY